MSTFTFRAEGDRVVIHRILGDFGPADLPGSWAEVVVTSPDRIDLCLSLPPELDPPKEAHP